MEEEYCMIRRLALDYVKSLYDGKIYLFSGHQLKGTCIKTGNVGV